MSISREARYGGVNLLESQTADVAITPHSNLVNLIEADADLDVTLPDARLLRLGGIQFIVCNIGTGGFDVTVKDATGSTVGTLADGESYKLSLASNGSAAGDWVLDARTIGSAGDPNPNYSALWGENNTTSDRTVIYYEHISQVSTKSVAASSPQTTRFVGGGAFFLSNICHRAYDDSSSAQRHWQYVVDTFTEKSRFTASTTSSSVKCALVNASKAIYFHIMGTDIFEWDVTDTWTELSNVGGGTSVVRGCAGTDGATTGVQFVTELNPNPSTPSNWNLIYEYTRASETGATAPTNPNVIQQDEGCVFGDDSGNLHIVGGYPSPTTADATNLHYAYDMSLGTAGAWSVKQVHGNANVPSPGASKHPTVTDRAVLMGCQSGTNVGVSNDDVWYYDEGVATWTFQANLSDFYKECCGMAAQLQFA